MRFKEVDFPETLLNAQKNGTLVIFAGAGVSMGPPANYPSFTQLANKVANNTLEREKDEPIDHFLGRLEKQGVQVHKRTCQFLSDPNSKPNPLHYGLLKLFPLASKVRLVTTNFDTHFTTAAVELFNDEVDVFYAAALPLGHNFNGIVHLHGCVEKGAERLVLIDSDFGRAYLTEGWARRFLQEMFSGYTVLFVGYSYNDPVVPYLTRGLPANSPGLRFALVKSDDDPKRWEFLGIEPLTYPLHDEPNKHMVLGEAVATWVQLTEMGALDHERRIQEIVELAPSPNSEDTDYIENALTDLVTTRFFTRHAKTPEWLRWAEGKGVFQPLFQANQQIGEISLEIASWFAQSFVCEYLDEALALVQRQGPRLHPNLWYAIANQIAHHNQSQNSQTLAKWIAVLLQSAQPGYNPNSLNYILSNCQYPKNNISALLLFEYLAKPRLDLRPGFHFYIENNQEGKQINKQSEQVDVEIYLTGGTYWINKSWRELFRPHLVAFAEKLQPILTWHLQQAHLQLCAMGKANENFDPISFRRAAIEPHEQDRFSGEMGILINAARDVLEWMLSNRLDHAHSVIETWSNSGIPLLKRLAVHGVTESNRFTSDEKINWILDRNWLFIPALKHEVFRLLKSVYQYAASSRSYLIKQVCLGPQGQVDQNSDIEHQYEIYNLLFCLLQADPNCSLVTQKFELMQQTHPNFQPRPYPDLSLSIISRSLEPDTPFTVDEMLAQEPELIVDKLLTYQGESFLGQPRYDLLESVMEAVARSFDWGWQLVTALHRQEKWNSDLWRGILYGWRQGTMTENQWENALTFFKNNQQLYEFADEIIDLLNQGVTKEQGKIPSLCLSLAEGVTEQLWEVCTAHSVNKVVEVEDWYSKAINNPGGKIVKFRFDSLLRRRSEAGNQGVNIPLEFKNYFHNVLNGASYAAELGRVILASQVHLLFNIDADWTRENILPLMDWSINSKQAQQAWHGFLTKGRWNEDLLPDLMPLYEKNFAHISTDLDSSELCDRFSKHLADIAVYGLSNPIQEGWLGKFLKAVNCKQRKRWALHVTQLLHLMQEDAAQNLWNRWIKAYWEDRITGIPLPLELDEMKEMIEWAVYFKPVFPEVVEKICNSPISDINYEQFYHKLAATDFPNIYPEPLARLLLNLLRHTRKSFWFGDVEKLVQNLIDSTASHHELQQICNQLARLGCPKAAGLKELLTEGSPH